jgi:tRNA threonylcarbamoyladenosine dehydratase
MTEHDLPAVDLERRFGALARLYGDAGYAALQSAHAVLVGVGGVGSWAAECLARSGVGRLTLIDLDHIAESNINRQVHALTETLGAAKVRALAARIRSINPACEVVCIEDFIAPDNVAALMPQDAGVVIDCIDQVRAKAALVAWCQAQRMPLITCGAAGGKTDATRITIKDLADATQDPLLAKMRARLRKDYSFAAAGKKLNVAAVFSNEPMRISNNFDAGAGINCAGFGSAMHITATMGLMAAGWAINTMIAQAAIHPPGDPDVQVENLRIASGTQTI